MNVYGYEYACRYENLVLYSMLKYWFELHNVKTHERLHEFL